MVVHLIYSYNCPNKYSFIQAADYVKDLHRYWQNTSTKCILQVQNDHLT